MWASVAKRLNCVIAMVDQLQEEDNSKPEPVAEQQLADVITSHNPGNNWSYHKAQLDQISNTLFLSVIQQ